jgi:uncharacterized membrane protein YvbJ
MDLLAYGVGIVAIIVMAVIFIKIIYSFGEEFKSPDSKPHTHH